MKKYLIASLLAMVSITAHAGEDELKIATVETLYQNGASNELLYAFGTDDFKEWYEQADADGDIDYILATNSQDLDEEELARTAHFDITTTGEVEATYDIFGETKSSYYKLECDDEVCLIDSIR